MTKKVTRTRAWLLTCSLFSCAPTYAMPQHRERTDTPDPNSGSVYEVPAFLHNPDPTLFFLAPDIEILGLDGEVLTSADLRGRVLLFEFWWSGCSSSMSRVSYLKSLTRQWADQPFTLISVHIDRETEEMRRLMRKYRMDWPQYQYSAGLRRQFKIQRYPTHILVDHEGNILLRESGWSNQVETRLDWEIGRALRAIRRGNN